MRVRGIIKSLIMLGALTSATVAAQENELGHTQLLNRINYSFSEMPLGTKYNKLEFNLTEILATSCHPSRQCSFVDRNGIKHEFEDIDGGLHGKSVSVHPTEIEYIRAFDVGIARDEDMVIKKISTFMGKAENGCRIHPINTAMHVVNYDRYVTCEWYVDTGFVSAVFRNKALAFLEFSALSR